MLCRPYVEPMVPVESQMAESETKLDLDSAYRQYRRRLFGALAILSRQGLPVQPADGLDLIQEFFATSWDGLQSRYDCARGPFDRYIFAAFIRFARPRILRLYRWQNSLVDAAKLAELVGGDRFEEAVDVEEPMRELIEQVLLALAPQERRVLYSYLRAGARGERKLAQEFGLTRYKIRETLALALGHLAVGLGERGVINERDWEVALALWRDGRSVRQTVRFLGRTVDEIKECRARIIGLLEGRLRRLEGGYSSRPRRTTMTSVRLPASELFKRVLSEPGNTALLEEVRARAEELISYLDESDSGPEVGAVKTDPAWLILVHEALAQEEPLSPEEEDLRAKLLQARANDEASVGRAFKEALVPDLPNSLTNWEYWFAAAPRASVEELNILMNQPSVQAASPISSPLAAFGLTPVSVYYATEAVSFAAQESLAHTASGLNSGIRIRVEEAPARSLPKSIELRPKSPDDWPYWDNRRVIPALWLAAEIVRMLQCPLFTAYALLAWLITVGQFKPFIFAGFESGPVGPTALELIPLGREGKSTEDQPDDDGENLYRRWGKAG
jgi:hypothetical protein